METIAARVRERAEKAARPLQHNTYDIELRGPNPMNSCFILFAQSKAPSVVSMPHARFSPRWGLFLPTFANNPG
jgi:hypothetical protein